MVPKKMQKHFIARGSWRGSDSVECEPPAFVPWHRRSLDLEHDRWPASAAQCGPWIYRLAASGRVTFRPRHRAFPNPGWRDDATGVAPRHGASSKETQSSRMRTADKCCRCEAPHNRDRDVQPAAAWFDSGDTETISLSIGKNDRHVQKAQRRCAFP